VTAARSSDGGGSTAGHWIGFRTGSTSTEEFDREEVTMGDAEDEERSALERRFETLKREITVAAREQGADPAENRRLRLALRRARESNVPDDEIERALEKGAGEREGPDWQEVTYEGYGPKGVAVFVEAITDDKKTTAVELGELFERHGGNLGEDGCVAWQFERRGRVEVDARDVDDEDDFMLEVIEMGADELREPLYALDDESHTSVYRVYCSYADTLELANELEEAGYRVPDAGPVREATQKVGLDPGEARKFLEFFEELSNREDVKVAYANWESAA
jgi:YebC/PmpR family DNA-binding regulatory protein